MKVLEDADQPFDMLPQLLVCIREAVVEMVAAAWGPFNMLTTLLRSLAGGALDQVNHYWSDALHLAQALTAHFKEPHANFVNAQDFLTLVKENRKQTMVVLLQI